jgi:hypothetical protein
LYHAFVDLEIDGSRPESRSAISCFMLGLEPPGNVARDLALFRRSLFSMLGDASCLALPEVVPLSFAFPPIAPAHRSRIELARALPDLWDGIEGPFASEEIVISRGLCYLNMRGPLEMLAERTTDFFKRFDLAPCADAVLEPGNGFFLCRSPQLNSSPADFAASPHLAFLDCSLVLLRLRYSADPFAAAAWRELARAKRHTGPSSVPSRRTPRRAN